MLKIGTVSSLIFFLSKRRKTPVKQKKITLKKEKRNKNITIKPRRIRLATRNGGMACFWVILSINVLSVRFTPALGLDKSSESPSEQT